jgi:ApbE superfamily uncharacterized protein (UPF0280 family)
MVTGIDDGVAGAVMHALQEKNMAANTLTIAFLDNGGDITRSGDTNPRRGGMR